MQRRDGGLDVVVGNQQAQVDLVGALGNHLHVHLGVAQGRENPRPDAALVLHVLAHDADNRAIGSDGDAAELLELFDGGIELVQFGAGHGNADLARGHHVDVHAVAPHHVKDLGQEAGLAQHALAFDRDDALAFLVGDAGDGAFVSAAVLRDHRAGVVGPVGVEHPHRNVVRNGRQQGTGVQHAPAVVGQFTCFGKTHERNASGLGNHAGVSGHHAVGVGPDFAFLGVNGAGDERGRKIAAVAAHGGPVARRRLADEAGDDGNRVLGHALVELGLEAGFPALDGPGLAKLVVGDEAQLVDVVGLGANAVAREEVRNDAAAHALAKARKVVVAARAVLAHQGDASEQVFDLAEVGVEHVVLAAALHEDFFLAVDDRRGVGLSRCGGLAAGDQGVGNALVG